MDVNEAIERRRSIRKYLRKPIPVDIVTKMLEAARCAPSGMNRQPWELVAVTDQNTKELLVPVCRNQTFISDCSLFIAGIDDPNEKWHRVDLAIAMEHIALSAVSFGLGTCWIGAFQPEKVKEILGIPEEKALVVCMTVGYPDESPAPREKRPVEKLVHWERY